MQKRHEICLTWEEGSSPLSYVIKSGDVVPVTGECATENCFTVEGTEFEIEFTFKDEVVTKVYKICDEDTDCEGCDECINNICVSTCTQKCYGSTCVECIVDGDCPVGYICSAFGCVIRPGWKECENGVVSQQCEEDCTSCQDYIGGECVNKICPPEGECLKLGESSKKVCLNGECVECINTGDCPVNECCVGNECECCPGFVRDRITGLCVPEDDCFDSTDCGECETCSLGKCMPVVCPQGYICLSGNCVNPCANNSDCPSGICKDGICVDDDSPCSGVVCITPNDCNEGCGCDGTCVECSQYNCLGNEDCPLGCNCESGTCQAIPPDDGDEDCTNVLCVDGSDCGEGCGCLDGRCVSCTSLDCFGEDCSTADGCACDEELNCVGTECEDFLSITKGDCSVNFKYNGDSRCACPQIGIGNSLVVAPNNGNVNLGVTLELRKGAFVNYASFLLNPLLSQTGVANDIPNSGTIRIETKVRYRRSNPQGNPIGNQEVYQTFNTADVTFIGIDTNSVNIQNVPQIGNVVLINNQHHVVTNVDVFREQQAIFNFPNTCLYTTSKVLMYAFAGVPILSGAGGAGVLTAVPGSSRLPLLEIYKSNTAGVYTNKVYSEYNTEIDLFHPFLEQFKYYKLSSDCGCAEDEVYKCGGAENRLVICDPTDFQFETINCGKDIRFLQDVVVTCDVVLNSSTKYRLKADGNVIVGNRSISGNGVVFHAGEIINVGYVFSEVTLEIVGDFCEECTVTKPVPFFELLFDVTPPSSVVVDCTDSGSTDWTLQVFNGSPDYVITVYLSGDIVYQGVQNTNTGQFTLPAVAGTYEVHVLDDNGCSDVRIVEWTPSEVENLDDASVSYVCQGANILFTLISGTTEPTTGTITYDGDDYIVGFTGTGQISVPYEEGGIYNVVIAFTNFVCDEFEQELEVTCCDPNPLNGLPRPAYTCADGVRLPFGPTLTWTQGETVLSNGMSFAPGIYEVQVTNGTCTRDLTLSVPTCYNCFNTACLESTVVPGYSTSDCDGACTSAEGNTEITYSCTLGLQITSDTPVSVFVGVTPVTNGAILSPGPTTFVVVETENAIQYNIENIVPQCLQCIVDCMVEDCCEPAVPNLGYTTCPEVCDDPPATCETCVSLSMTTADAETYFVGVMIDEFTYLFEDLGLYNFSILSNIVRFKEDFAAAITAQYPVSRATCFDEIDVQQVEGEYVVTVNCMCDADGPFDWRLIAFKNELTVSYNVVSDPCVTDPIEDCVCVHAEGLGSVITGIFDGATNIFDHHTFTLASYNVLNNTQRVLLQTQLHEYYTRLGGNCELTVEVNYNAFTTQSEVTICCLDASRYNLPDFYQIGGEPTYAFNFVEPCECGVGENCFNTSYQVDILESDGNITDIVLAGYTLSAEVGFSFPYNPSSAPSRASLNSDVSTFLGSLEPCCDEVGVVNSSFFISDPSDGICTLTFYCIPSSSPDHVPLSVEQGATETQFTLFDQGYDCCILF